MPGSVLDMRDTVMNLTKVPPGAYVLVGGFHVVGGPMQKIKQRSMNGGERGASMAGVFRLSACSLLFSYLNYDSPVPQGLSFHLSQLGCDGHTTPPGTTLQGSCVHDHK